MGFSALQADSLPAELSGKPLDVFAACLGAASPDYMPVPAAPTVVIMRSVCRHRQMSLPGGRGQNCPWVMSLLWLRCLGDQHRGDSSECVITTHPSSHTPSYFQWTFPSTPGSIMQRNREMLLGVREASDPNCLYPSSIGERKSAYKGKSSHSLGLSSMRLVAGNVHSCCEVCFYRKLS